MKLKNNRDVFSIMSIIRLWYVYIGYLSSFFVVLGDKNVRFVLVNRLKIEWNIGFFGINVYRLNRFVKVICKIKVCFVYVFELFFFLVEGCLGGVRCIFLCLGLVWR